MEGLGVMLAERVVEGVGTLKPELQLPVSQGASLLGSR